MRHPPEDVGVAAKLRERAYLGVCGAEIAQEVADGSPVVASGFGMERSCERGDGAVEGIRQRMLKRRSPCAIHERFPGRGRMCWATARAYCEVDVLRSDLNIYQCGLDIGVAHQAHERREADAGPHHV